MVYVTISNIGRREILIHTLNEQKIIGEFLIRLKENNSCKKCLSSQNSTFHK